MKLTIRYQPYDGYNDPLRDNGKPYAAAIAEINGKQICAAHGKSYKEARNKLIERLKEFVSLGDIPENEEVEATYRAEEFIVT